MLTTPLPRLITFGRLLFALGIAFFGLQQLAYGQFVTRILPPWPAWLPAHGFGVYASGALLVVTATALLCGVQARRAAHALAAWVLLSAVAIALPDVLLHLTSGTSWANAGKAFALGGGALIAAATQPIEHHSPIDRVFILVGRMLVGGFFILCGIEHFLYVQYVVLLVPGWIGAAVFWTYFAGVALILAGAGLVFCIFIEWAALLAGAMIFAWVFLLHIPRALANLRDANESTAVFEALALSGICFMLAGRLWQLRPARVEAKRPAHADIVRPPLH